MPRSESREIGGRTFTVHQLPLREYRDLYLTLLNVMGPGLAALGSGGDASEGGSIGMIMGGIGGLLTHLSPAQVDRFESAFAKRTFIDLGGGRKPLLSDCMDEAFADAPEFHFEWLLFAGEVNFAGFFGVLRRAIVRAFAKRSVVADGPGTSSG